MGSFHPSKSNDPWENSRRSDCIRMALMIALVCTACSAGRVPIIEEKAVSEDVVVHWAVAEDPEEQRKYTKGEIQEIEAAKDIVKEYWTSSNEDKYELFSSNYKALLRRIDGVDNRKDFKNCLSMSERVWRKQSYQRTDIGITRHGKQYAQIVVLTEWSEEGYWGVMTVIFNMLKEDGEWKINNIMH